MFELGPYLRQAFETLQSWVIGHGAPALGAWILLGVIASRTKRSAAVPVAVPPASSPAEPGSRRK